MHQHFLHAHVLFIPRSGASKERNNMAEKPTLLFVYVSTGSLRTRILVVPRSAFLAPFALFSQLSFSEDGSSTLFQISLNRCHVT
jgi:hypothetical protein